MHIERQ